MMIVDRRKTRLRPVFHTDISHTYDDVSHGPFLSLWEIGVSKVTMIFSPGGRERNVIFTPQIIGEDAGTAETRIHLSLTELVCHVHQSFLQSFLITTCYYPKQNYFWTMKAIELLSAENGIFPNSATSILDVSFCFLSHESLGFQQKPVFDGSSG